MLFRSETWVLTPWLEKSLQGFHHWAAWRMAGMFPKHKPERMWVYPPIGLALAMAGLEDIKVYISRCQNTVARYIATCPTIDLCLAADWMPVMRLSRQW